MIDSFQTLPSLSVIQHITIFSPVHCIFPHISITIISELPKIEIHCSFYQVFFAINVFLLVIDSAFSQCRHPFRDSFTIKSAGLEMDILSVVFSSALCKIDDFVVVSVTVMLMQHHIAVFATAFVMVLVTVI
jgi:hypothetical protein